MNRRILLVTSEIPAQLGYPTAGGGLRAWNIAQGLRRRGFEVNYALMENVARNRDLPREHTRYLWNPATLEETVLAAAPDVAIFCQWDPMSFANRFPCPVVVDLFGLLLLENWFRGGAEIQIQAQTKLRTLAKADAFLVTSPTLKAYFTAWLTMAGCSPEDFPLLDVPISMPDEQPPYQDRNNAGDLVFVYSGIFWPWQNPLLPLQTLVDVLEKRNRGRLLIYGGKHPVHPLPENVAESAMRFLDAMAKSSRVEIRGLVPHEELMASFADADVAVDLMERNIERELSSPIRSACYLWAGLPLVVSDYLYLAKDLENCEAGWSADPSSREAMSSLFEWMLDHPEEVRARRENARQFAHQRFVWSVALEPLARFCAEPRYRAKGRHLMDITIDLSLERQKKLDEQYRELERLNRALAQSEERYHRELGEWIREKDRLAARLHSAEHDLTAIRSKFLFRFFKRIQDLIAPERKPTE